MPAPFMLAIEPTNLCNLKCAFCPTSDEKLLTKVGREKGSMPLELFRKVVDGARQFPVRMKEVCLFKDGEPLLNKDICGMISYLKQVNICDVIKIFTNGLLLTPELNRELVSAGLDFIRISVEGVHPEKYESLCGRRIDYQHFIDNIKDLYEHRGSCRVVIKIIDVNLTMTEKEKFFRDFADICDICAIDDIHGWTCSDEKDFALGIKKDTFDGVKIIDKNVCPYPFYTLCVNCRGIVTIGCCDWALKTEVGRVPEQSVYEIWNGKKLHDFRMMHLEHRKAENPACRSCSHMRINPDNLDGYEKKIIAALNNAFIRNPEHT